MATQSTGGGSVQSFGNAPQAQSDSYTTVEDAAGVFGTNVILLAVMANDSGGNAKSLFSVDNGTVSAGVTPVSGGDADLLTKDTAYADTSAATLLAAAAVASDTSALGARIWITTDGKIAYDTSTPAIEHLQGGVTYTDSFVYAIQMGNGTLSWTTVTIQITGANDASVLSSVTAAPQMVELANTTGSHAADTASASFTFTDGDFADTHIVSVGAASAAWSGGSTLPAGLQAALNGAATATLLQDSTNGATGKVNVAFSAADATFDFLAAGETLTVTYNVTVDDQHGGKPVQSVTFKIVGTNDGPVLAADAVASHAVAELAGQTNVSTADTASAALSFTDVDLSDTHTVAAAAPTIVWAGHATLPAGLASALAPASALTLSKTDSTGTGSGSVGVGFHAADNTFDFLAGGETLAVTYNVTVTDNNGAASTRPVTFTVTGTNDAPVLSADAIASHAASGERAGVTGADTGDSASATLGFTDVDLDDHHTVSAGAPTVTWNGGATLPAGLASALTGPNALTLTVTDSTGTGAGSVGVAFSAADKTFDFLAAGETLTVTYSITVSDGTTTSSQPVTFTVTGTNDAPVLAADSVASHAVTGEQADLINSAAADTASATLTFADVDLNDTHSVSFGAASAVRSSGGALPSGLQAALNGAVHAANVSDSTHSGAGSFGVNFSTTDSNFDFLAAGETLTVTYNVTVSDNNGGNSTQPVTFTITGTNDAPVITSAPQVGAVTEDSIAAHQAAGTIAFSDVDLIDTHTASAALKSSTGSHGLLGTFSVDVNAVESAATADGTFGWTYSLNDAAAQYLAQGQTVTETYTVTFADGHGGTVSQDVTLTITGTNDKPTITSAAQTGSVIEDSVPAHHAAGTIAFADVDLIDTHTASYVAAAGQTALGTFQVDASATEANGAGTFSWTYVLDDAKAQYLAQGQAVAETYTVTVADNHGGTVTQDVTVTITGTNDKPTITSSAQAGSVTEDSASAHQAAGAIAFNDVDLIDTHTVGFTPAAGQTALGTFTLGSVSESDATSAGTVGWTYTLNDAAADYLAAGQQVTETYTVTVDDGHGGTISQDVTVTITGANDKPVITSTAQTGAVTEDSLVAHQAAGAVAFNDVDLIDHHTASVVAASGQTALGTFALGSVSESDTTTAGTVGWTYTLNDTAADYLAAGQQVTETYTVTVDDGHGGTTSQDVTVTITGANDAPIITSSAQAGAVTEDSAAAHQATGTIGFNDVDLIDHHTASITPAGGQTALGTFALGSVSESDLTSGGSVGWTYTLNDDAADYMAAGQQVTETYTVTVDDGHGGTTSQDVTVTITGANDKPTITSSAQTGAVTEDSSVAHQAAGAVAFNDVDLIDHHTTSITPAAGQTALGTFALGSISESDLTSGGSVGWTYTLNDAAADYLASGQQVTETYSVTVDDGHGGAVSQNVVVTITGTNDKPTITSSAQSGSVVEDSAAAHQAAGTVAFADVDLIDTHTASYVAAAGQTALGTFQVDVSATEANGAGTFGWTYVLDDAKAQYLAQGQIVTETYTVTVADNHGGTVTQDVTVTITGTNDAPVISLGAGDSAAATVTETNAGLSSTGHTLTVTDADLSDTVTASVTGVVASGTTNGLSPSADVQGMLSVTPGAIAADPTDAHNLAWGFDSGLEAFDYLAAGEHLTLTYTVQVDDGHGGTDQRAVVVTVDGTNDGPVLAIDAGGPHAVSGELANVTGQSTADTASTTLTFTDADLSDTHTYSAGAPHIVWSGNAALPFGLSGALAAADVLTLTPHDSTGTGSGSLKVDFAAADQTFDFLADGETLTVSYDITVDDGHAGGTSTRTVTFTVAGSNDGPVLSADAFASHAVTGELTGVTGQPTLDTASATLAFIDVDLSDSHTVSASGPTVSWSGGATLPAGLTGALSAANALTLTPSDSTGTGSGSVDVGFHVADSAFDFLAAGETLTVSYDVTVKDGDNAASTQTVTFTVSGTNDAPVLAADAAGPHAVTGEIAGGAGLATADTASATLSFADVDLDDTHTVSVSAATAAWTGGANLPGGLQAVLDGAAHASVATDSTHSGSGSVGVSFSAADANFDFLAAGETLTVSYDVTVKDEHDVASTRTVSFTVAGTNDKPVVTGHDDGAVTEAAHAPTETTAGSVTFTDLDLTDSHTPSALFKTTDGPHQLGSLTTQLGADTTGSGVGGLVGWNYSVDDSAIQYLAAGETVHETYTVTVDDGHGGTTSQDVVITITGANDAPMITGHTDGAVTEDASSPATAESTNGTVSFTDVDLTDGHTAIANFKSSDYAGGRLGGMTAGVGVDTTGSGAGGVVNWHYAVNDSAIQFLAAGQTIHETYTVAVNDGHGGITTQDVVVTITGANDAPIISVGASDSDSALLTETNAKLSTAGALSVNDPDLTDHVNASVTGVSLSGVKGGLTAGDVLSMLTVDTGDIAADPADSHNLAWAFDSGSQAFDFLAASEHLVLSYTVKAADAQGAFDTHTVTIDITGTNDAPVVTGGQTTGAVTEDATSPTEHASGTLSFTDADLSDTHSARADFKSSDGGAEIGAMTAGVSTDTTGSGADGAIHWQYAAPDALTQKLAEGQTVHETFTVSLTDAPTGAVTTQDVVITITGTNDKAVISGGQTTGAVTEDAHDPTETATGALSFTDVDLTDTHSARADFKSVGGSTQIGSMTAGVDHDTTGTGTGGVIGWDYSVADSFIQSLAEGQSIQETYTVTVDDHHTGGVLTQDVVITLNGSNDGPTLVGAGTVAAGGVTEDSAAAHQAAGQVAFDDVDLIDHHTASYVAAAGQTGLGTFALGSVSESDLTSGGSVGWTYTLNDAAADYLAAGQTVTETYTVTVDDGHTGTVSQDVVVTITGANDKPVITSSAQTGAVAEDSVADHQAGGAVTFDDVDLIDHHAASIIPAAGQTALGTFALGTVSDDDATAAGSVGWTYTLNDASADYLAAGQQVTETYTVTVDDGHGGTASQDVVLTITGANDKPVITGGQTTGAVTEDAHSPSEMSNGTLSFTDVDLTDTHTATANFKSVGGSTQIGGMTAGIDHDTAGTGAGGVVGWHYAVSDSAIQFLAEGQSIQQTYTITLDDQHTGGVVTDDVVVTLTGTNDGPTIVDGSTTAAGSVVEDAVTPDSLHAAGTIAFTDPDLIDTHTAAAVLKSTTGDQGPLGTFHVDAAAAETATTADGTFGWTYDLTNSAAQYLAAGQTVTETYTVTIDDGHAGVATKDVTVTITGTNDTPTITLGASDSDSALLTETNAKLATNGALSVNDPDLTDHVNASVTGVSLSGVKGGLTVGDVLTMLTVDTGDIAADPADSHNLAWAFDSGSQAFDFLAAGEHLVLSYTVKAADTQGAFDTHTVTIDITGTNDAPVVTAHTNGAVTEDASSPATSETTNGTVSFTDVDLSDTHTAYADFKSTDGAARVGSMTAGIGHDTTGSGTGGVVNWQYAAPDSLIQYLAAGQTVHETYTVFLDHGQADQTTQDVVVTLTGTNDGPTLVGAGTVAAGGVTEDSAAAHQATGAVAFDDVDLIDHHTASFTPAAGQTALGTFTLGSVSESDASSGGTVGWTYALNDAAADYLAAGQTVTETYTVAIDDGHGGQVSQAVTVTITGANDKPTITSAAQTGAVTEDSSVAHQAAGAVAFNDVDLIDHHTASFAAAAGQTALGTFALGGVSEDDATAAGSVGWTYTLNDAAADYLAAGQQVTETYTVTVDDGHGGTASQGVTVTITGANDKPVITNHTDGAVTEDANVPTEATNGTVSFTDVDLTDTHTANAQFVSTDGAARVGAMVAGIGTDTTGTGAGGVVNWQYDVSDSAIQYLAAGQTVHETYAVDLDDGHGGTVTQNVVVTITGTNDAPVVTAHTDGAVTEDAHAGSETSNGTVSFSDVDLTDSHSAIANFKSSDYAGGRLGGMTAGVGVDTTGSGTGGAVNWTYAVNDSAIQFLAAGQTVHETYTVSVSDGHGGVAQQDVVVAITGTNDAPMVTAHTDGAVTEDAHASPESANGTVSFTDVDLADTHTSFYADFVSTDGAAQIGSMVAGLGHDTTGTGTGGVVNWQYLAPDSLMQYLAAGQTVHEHFNVFLDHGQADQVAQDVEITLTGTNDGPTIVAGPTTAAGGVTEDSVAAHQAAGQVAFDDVDLIDHHTASYMAAAGQTGLGTFALGSVSESDLTSGGSVGWTYTLNDAAADYLAAGQTVTETYTVTVDDGHGGTVNQNVVVTITGANDKPVITSSAQIGAVTEDSVANHQAGGAITFDDVDLIDHHTASITPAAGQTALGTFALGAVSEDDATAAGSVGWTYTLNDASADYLAAGQTVTETYTVTVNDGHGGTASQDVAVTITGANDKPVVLSHTDGAVTEDAHVSTETTTGTVSFADVDLTDSHTANAQFVSTDGVARVGAMLAGVGTDTTGAGTGGVVNWQYVAPDSLIQYLAAGQTVHETYAVNLDDGHGGTVTQNVVVTITGTNDAPVIAGHTDGAVTEDASSPAASETANGTVSFTDVDLTDGHTAIANFKSSDYAGGRLGGMTAGVATDTTGSGAGGVVNWHYAVNDSAIQFLAAGQTIHETYTVAVNDGHGGITTQDVVVTITGTNDAPTLNGVAAAAAYTEQASPVTLASGLTVADIDNANLSSAHVSIASGLQAGDTLAANVSGTSITASYNVATGVLTLTGSDTVAHYQQVLASVTFANTTNDNPTNFGANPTRTLDWVVNDGIADSGHASSTVNVTAVNDAPALASVAASAAYTEDAAPVTLSSGLTVADADNQTLASAKVTFSAGFQSGDALAANVTGTSITASFAGGILTLSGADTLAHYQQVLRTVTYASSSQDPTSGGANATRTLAWTVNDGAVNSTAASTTLNLTAVNDAPVNTVPGAQTAVVNTNLSITGLSVADVGAGAGSVKTTLSVAHGTLTVVSSGGAAVTGSGTGSVTLNGTIGQINTTLSALNGVIYKGVSNYTGPDTLTVVTNDNGHTGTGGSLTDTDTVAIGVTSPSTATLTTGTDTVFYESGTNQVNGTNTTATNGDTITGGTGVDTLTITDSSIALTFGNIGNSGVIGLQNVEFIKLIDTANANHTDTITFAAGFANGQPITLDATGITGNNGKLSVNASAAGGPITVIGSANADTIIGSTSGDTFTGGASGDVFTYTNANQSTLAAFDTITDFSAALDKISFNNMTGITAVQGALSSQINAHSVGWVVSGGNTMVLVNTTAASESQASAQMKIVLTGTPTLTTANFTNLPAGVAGSAINLALTAPLGAPAGTVLTETITGVPAGWSLDGATQVAEGVWTIQTTDPASLTITPSASFTGAALVNVLSTWTNADGTSGAAMVMDNVEAFAPRAPIFAHSSADSLTGSAGADTFVFAQPVGADTIHHFDVAQDAIDLIGFAGVSTFADIQALTANGAGGNAVITLNAGETITLAGVDAASLTAADFLFGQEPTMTNAGTMTIGDSASLPLDGQVINSGTIALTSTGSEVDLEILPNGVTLTGGGQVTLSDAGQNVIYGATPQVLLTNVDNTISGAGQIGAGSLTLVNEGTIDANGAGALVVDTGSNTVTNSGLIEATAAGGLTVLSALDNSGALVANGGDLHLMGAVSGSGLASIFGSSTIEFGGAASTAVTFDAAASGTLKLDASTAFTGAVSGFGAADHLDLADIASGATVSYLANADAQGGVLTVSDGARTAHIALVGQYDPAGFHVGDDHLGGALVGYWLV